MARQEHPLAKAAAYYLPSALVIVGLLAPRTVAGFRCHRQARPGRRDAQMNPAESIDSTAAAADGAWRTQGG